MSHHTKNNQYVKVANPAPGHHSHMSHVHATRLVKKSRAHWDQVGRIVLHYRGWRNGDAPVIQDARPGMPILPPSAEWLDRMGYNSHHAIKSA